MIDDPMPLDCRYNCLMSPQLTIEQRVKAEQMYLKAIWRYKEKWGTWPGWKSRAQILGGVNMAVKSGRDRRYTMRMICIKAGKARYRQQTMEGLTRSEIAKRIYERRRAKAARLAQQEIEARRAARARTREETSDRLWLRY